MTHLPLHGAGFTPNWNGWLAGELADDLTGRLSDHDDLHRRLTTDPNFNICRSFEHACARRGPD